MISAWRCRQAWRATSGALLLASAAMVGAPAAAETLGGVALVVGQSDYDTLADLPNTARDADAIEALLGDLGFDADATADRDARRLRRDLDSFLEDAAGADVAVFYYAGHAVEIGGENFLVPTDADAASPEALAGRLVSLTDYVEALRRKARITIVLLDACRNNPFPPGQTVKLAPDAAPVPIGAGGLQSRGVVALASGAAQADKGLGTVIAFAAEPGKVALDGDPGGNSPYAAALLRHLSAMTGEEFGTVMRMVAEEVYLKTDGRQRPWVNESLRRLLYFGAAAPDPAGEAGDLLRERRRLLLTIADLPDPKRRQVERIAAAGGVPMDAVYGMLRALGADIPDEPAALEKVLTAQTARLRQMLAERAALTETDPEIRRLSELAAAAIDEGALDTALALNERAKARVKALAPALAKAETDLKARWTEAAAVYARSAQAYEVAFDFRKAADDYAAAFAMIERWDDRLAWKYKASQAFVLEDHGVYFGDRAALEQAVGLNREALALAARIGAPELWADSVNYLATALARLGEREGRPDRLHEAVATYRAALRALDPARMPGQWRQLQNNLGNALSELGDREADPRLLEEAVVVYEALLRAAPRGEDRQQWLTTRNNLANALLSLGMRDPGPERLRQAVEIFRALLGEADREADPMDWATRQGNLAGALISLGEREGDRRHFEEAADALRATLDVYRRDRLPQNWAATQYNLAKALAGIGRLETGTARLEQAVAADRAALEEWTRDKAPFNWAQTHNNLGNLMNSMARRTGDTALLEAAAGHFEAALEVMTRDAAPLEWGNLQNNLANSLAELGRRRDDPALLARAVERYGLSLEVLTRAHLPRRWADVEDARANALFALAAHEAGTDAVGKALAGKRAVLEVVTRRDDPARWADVTSDIGSLLAMLGERSQGAARKRLWKEALAAWRDAQTVHSRDADAERWASLQDEIGYRLILLGEEEGNARRFEEALAVLRSVPDARGVTLAEDPLVSAQLCRALYGLGSRSKDRTLLTEAQALCRTGAAGLESRGERENAAITSETLAKVEKALARLQ